MFQNIQGSVGQTSRSAGSRFRTSRSAKSRLRIAARLAAFCLVAVICASCAVLNRDAVRERDYMIPPAPDSLLAEAFQINGSGRPPDESGFLAVDGNAAALRWRLALSDAAETSIDAQYYIWHGDESGLLLLNRLLSAADRGVRVRLLVDDHHLKGFGRDISIISLHPNIKVRTYNPYQSRLNSRLFRTLEFLIHFDRLNHRMHNKLFVADNQVAMVGGRNIGNAYFGLSKKANFRDVDLLASGPVVRDISSSFDAFWNSEWAYPIHVLSLLKPKKDKLAWLRKSIRGRIAKRREIISAFGVNPRDWTAALKKAEKELIWGRGHVIYDRPHVGTHLFPVHIAREMDRIIQETRKEIFIVTSYFIPTEEGVAILKKLTDRGVRIRVLTNSLASTDVIIANTGYKRYRRMTLEAGAELYEFRPDARDRGIFNTPPVEASRVCLHAKAIIFDRKKVYVGTMNLDPRSVTLNTEIGLLVESPELAARIQDSFEHDLRPENSWQVMLDEKDRIFWKSDRSRRYLQPARSLFQRIVDLLYSPIPLEDQL